MLKAFAYLQSFLAEQVRRDDRGVTAVEYAVLLVGVGVVLIGALKLFGPALGGVFSKFAGRFP